MNILKWYKELLFPKLYIFNLAPAIIAALIAAGGTVASLASQKGTKFNVDQYSTMTPEQREAYTQMLTNLQGYNPQYVGESGYNPEAYTGGYTPTTYTGGYNPTGYTGGYDPTQYQNQYENYFQKALSGQPSTEVNRQTTEDFYRESIERPALRQYEEEVRPAWMEKISGIHSSARDKMEQKGYEDLYSNLQSQRGSLLYQDEQARRGLAETAAERQLGAAGTLSGQGLSAWQGANQNLYNQANLGQQAWSAEQANQLAAAQQAQNAWATQNQLGLTANQQNQQAWQSYQNLLLGQDQNQLNYQLAQLQQSQIPYQLLMQALQTQGVENIGQEKSGGLISSIFKGLF